MIGKKYPTNKIAEIIPKNDLSPEGVDLLRSLLIANPKKRISAKRALTHLWFKGEMATREQMPKHTPCNELDRVKKRQKMDDEK